MIECIGVSYCLGLENNQTAAVGVFEVEGAFPSNAQDGLVPDAPMYLILLRCAQRLGDIELFLQHWPDAVRLDAVDLYTIRYLELAMRVLVSSSCAASLGWLVLVREMRVR